MPAPGADQDRHHRFHRQTILIQFDEAFARENQINLRGLFVVMRLGGGGNVDEMHGRERILRADQTASGGAAGARLRGQGVELTDEIVFQGKLNAAYTALDGG